MLDKLMSMATLPGEMVLSAAINAGSKHREGMSQENRDRYDALGAQILEDSYAVWRSLVVRAGLLPEKKP